MDDQQEMHYIEITPRELLEFLEDRKKDLYAEIPVYPDDLDLECKKIIAVCIDVFDEQNLDSWAKIHLGSAINFLGRRWYHACVHSLMLAFEDRSNVSRNIQCFDMTTDEFITEAKKLLKDI